MIFKIKMEDGTTVLAEGADAYPLLKRAYGIMSRQILMPVPPNTTKIRARASAALRRGESVSDHWDDDGQPAGLMVIQKMEGHVIKVPRGVMH